MEQSRMPISEVKKRDSFSCHQGKLVVVVESSFKWGEAQEMQRFFGAGCVCYRVWNDIYCGVVYPDVNYLVQEISYS